MPGSQAASQSFPTSSSVIDPALPLPLCFDGKKNKKDSKKEESRDLERKESNRSKERRIIARDGEEIKISCLKSQPNVEECHVLTTGQLN